MTRTYDLVQSPVSGYWTVFYLDAVGNAFFAAACRDRIAAAALVAMYRQLDDEQADVLLDRVAQFWIDVGLTLPESSG